MSESDLTSTRNVTDLVVHCTDTRAEWMWNGKVEAKVKEIDRWHKARGWSGFGYHFIIDRDGTIAEGRHVNRTGAHVKGHNLNSIGIVLVGGYGCKRTDKFEKHFTKEQDKALRSLLVELSEHNPVTNIKGHHDYDKYKECPGFKVSKWMK